MSGPAVVQRALVMLVVFVAGATLMSTEVLAFRIIGRTFGTALRETSAVIAVFLGAMSVGYALGGRLGDRRPALSSLAGPPLVAGLLIAVVPVVSLGLSEAVATSRLPLSTHAIVATIALFALPVALLAAVTPIAIRLSTHDVARAGHVAGGMSALSTLGSIAGTLTTGFYLLGHVAISTTLRGIAIALVALGLVTAIVHRRRGVALMALFGVAATAALVGPAAALGEVRYEHDSAYHHIRVVDRGRYRHLMFDDTRQSRMLIDNPASGGYEYTEHFHSAWLFRDEIDDVLFIGLGGATGPKQFLADYPHVTVHAVDVDPAVVDVAERFFGLPVSPRLDVEVADGRTYLRSTESTFDVIVVDAYNSGRYGNTIPFQLTTREFFEIARERLSPGGVLMYNVIEPADEPDSAFLFALVKTMSAAGFREFTFFLCDWSGNTVVVGLTEPRHLDRDALTARAQALVDAGRVPRPQYVDEAARVYDGEVPWPHAITLTDDFAPVDRLLRD